MVGSGRRRRRRRPDRGRAATSSSAWVVADYDLARARAHRRRRRRARRRAASRFVAAAQVDASDAAAVAALAREHGATHVLNAVDPRFVHADLRGRAGGRRRLPRHGDVPVRTRTPSEPYAKVGVKLGDEQFAAGRRSGTPTGRLALVGIGVEPGPVRRVRPLRRRPPVRPDRRARHPRRRQPRRPRRRRRTRSSRPAFSIWTTIEECLNPPVVWDRPSRGGATRGRLLHAPPFPEPEVFDFPERHRPGRVRARRARGGAPHAALGRRPQGHLQVRPGRGVHRRPAHAAHARPRPHRAGARQAACRCQPARRRRRRACPTRRRSARG